MAGRASFTPTEDGYVKAMRLHASAHMRGAVGRRLAMLIVAASVVMSGAMLAIDRDLPGALAMLGSGLIGGTVGILAMFGLNRRFAVPILGRRLFRQDRTIRRRLDVAWDANGVDWRSESGGSHMTWDHYHAWTERNGMLLLYVNDRLFQHLPVRDLADGDDLAATVAASGLRRL